MNLIDIFRPSLRGRTGKTAFHFQSETVTFGQLDTWSDNAAAGLREKFGVAKGDRAGLFVENCKELVVYYLACMKLGAIMVPFNVLYRDHELSYLLDDAEPKVLLTDRERLPIVEPLCAKSACRPKVLLAGPADGGALSFNALMEATALMPSAFAQVDGGDPAIIVYTSGTTGRSKGAVLTNNNLASNIVSLLHCWQWTESDRFVLALPMFHLHGLGNGLNGALSSGCTTYVLQRFKAEAVLNLLSAEKCTLYFGVPTMYERMLEAASAGAPVPKSMRLYVSGSAALSPDAFARFHEVFGHQILERYGMSETAMITSNPYSAPRVPGSVGLPLPGIEVRILKDGQGVPGTEVGEIHVRGPNIFKEYWRAPEKTRESFHDGWFKTGDLGFIDADGYVHIAGRNKELIISGGFNIYPQEVAQCLCRHPDVAEAAVTGVTDKLRGELVKAYVVRKSPELTADALTTFCKEHLASFKVPKEICFLDALPRNALGKLQLHLLPKN